MIEKIKHLLPLDIYLELESILKNRQISPSQLSHILANCHHECQWSKYDENLNYKADRLLVIFPNRFRQIVDNSEKLKAAEKICAGGAVSIGNFLYGGRMGNSLTEGYTYRGRGCLQLTGKTNYIAFDATVIEDVTTNPDLVKTKYKLTSAFWFFDVNKIWASSVDISDKNIIAVRKKVNGGTIGLEDTAAKVKMYNKALTA
jgi:putative chitinase